MTDPKTKKIEDWAFRVMLVTASISCAILCLALVLLLLAFVIALIGAVL